MRRLRTRKAEEALAFLALHQTRWVGRSELIETVWGEDNQASRQKLRLALHSIRASLGNHLITDGDMVRVQNLEVDVLDSDLASLGSSWRLMPAHRIDWLDLFAVRLQAQQELEDLAQLGASTPAENRLDSLTRLIGSHANEPHLYKELHDLLASQGQKAAAAMVRWSASTRFGSQSPLPPLDRASQASWSDFHGRVSELVFLGSNLLSQTEPALTQVIGVGGMGKTRLAQELTRFAQEEEIESLWVSLRGVSESSDARVQVESALCNALSLNVEDLRDPASIPPFLLTLDNAEALAPSGLSFLRELLQPGCGLRVLVTSQRPFDLDYPILRLGPLSMPRGETFDHAVLSQSCQLLLRHAQATVLPSEIEPWIELARLSGGIPLAIKMLAQQCRVRAAEEVCAGLQSSSHQWKFRSPLAQEPEEHLSLQATLSWGASCLLPDQQMALRRLSELDGELESQGAEALGISVAVLHQLTELGWIELERNWRMLPPVRDYWRSHGGAETGARERLRDFLIEKIRNHYPENYSAVTTLAECYRADIHRMVMGEQEVSPESFGHLLVGFQITSHHYGLEERFLSEMSGVLAHVENPSWRNLMGATEYVRYEFDKAEGHFGRVASAARDPEVASAAVANIALVAMSRGDFERAETRMRDAVSSTHNARRRATRTLNLGSLLMMQGKYSESVEMVEGAMAAFEEIGGHDAHLALSLLRRAESEYFLGQNAKASISILAAYQMFLEHKQWNHMAELVSVGVLITRGKDPVMTESYLRNPPSTPVLAATLGFLLLLRDEVDPASELLSKVDPVRLPIFHKHWAAKRSVQLGRNPSPPRRSEILALTRFELKRG